MKTVREMAKESAKEWIKCSETNNSLLDACALHGYGCGFLAGYEMAMKQISDKESKIKDE